MTRRPLLTSALAPFTLSLLALLAACSSDAPDRQATPDAATPDASDAGAPKEAGPSGEDDGGPCVDREQAACMPIERSLGGAQLLALVGDDVYSLKRSPLVVQKTSLETGLSVDVGAPLDASLADAFRVAAPSVAAEGSLFLVSTLVTPSFQGAIAKLDLATGTWARRDLDLGNGDAPSFAAVAAGWLFLARERTLAQWSTADLTPGAKNRLDPEQLVGAVSDGATMFLRLRRDDEDDRVVRFDGAKVEELARLTDDLSFIPALAVDATTVYTAQGDEIVALDKAKPGPARVVADVDPGPLASDRRAQLIVADDRAVYWSDVKGLHAAPKAGGEPSLVVPYTTTTDGAWWLGQTARHLVYASRDGLRMVRK